MRAAGVISALCAAAGAALPSFYWSEPWGYLVSLVLFTCVAVAHDAVLRPRP